MVLDFKFSQNNPKGPEVWGDFELAPDGSLEVIRDVKVDIQDAVIRLLTDQASLGGFRLYPGVGASLASYLGQPLSLDVLRQVDKAARNSLTRDKRFPGDTQVKTISMDGMHEATVTVIVPRARGSQVLRPPITLDAVRGINLNDDATASPIWKWRRGQAAIQQSYRLWRGWYNSRILWRLSPEGLVTTKISESDLLSLGYFPEPLQVYDGGFLFCGKGAELQRIAEKRLFAPRAHATASGWEIHGAVQEVATLPTFSLEDGVWCNEATGYDLVIVISGVTAAMYDEELQRWKFIRVTEIAS